jgi:hypothetical protein
MKRMSLLHHPHATIPRQRKKRYAHFFTGRWRASRRSSAIVPPFREHIYKYTQSTEFLGKKPNIHQSHVHF